LRLFSLDELVLELEADFDLLEADRCDLPERHRSMRAVFEHSWRLLSPDEQSALSRLAVFRGGFSREAAEAVAGASARTLLSLVNGSLLARSQSGRFVMLELVRQYAAEKCRELQQVAAPRRLLQGAGGARRTGIGRGRAGSLADDA
jgi:predicted ATPase